MKKHTTGHILYLTSGTHIVKVKLNIPENPIGVTLMCDDREQAELVSRNELVSQIFNKECFITMQAVKENNEVCDGAVVLPAMIQWLEKEPKYSYLPVAVFCSGNSAGSILQASVNAGKKISAIAIRSGNVDLPHADLGKVDVPVLFIVADRDEETSRHIKEILPHFRVETNFKVISNATRYFSELGKLGHVVFLAVEWFRKNMYTKAKTA